MRISALQLNPEIRRPAHVRVSLGLTSCRYHVEALRGAQATAGVEGNIVSCEAVYVRLTT